MNQVASAPATSNDLPARVFTSRPVAKFLCFLVFGRQDQCIRCRPDQSMRHFPTLLDLINQTGVSNINTSTGQQRAYQNPPRLPFKITYAIPFHGEHAKALGRGTSGAAGRYNRIRSQAAMWHTCWPTVTQQFNRAICRAVLT